MKKSIIGLIIVAAIVAAAAGFVVCLNPFECSKNVTISVNNVELNGDVSVINGTVEVPNDVNFEQVKEDDAVWNKNTGDEKLEILVAHCEDRATLDSVYKEAIEANSRDSQLKEIDNDDLNNAHVYEVKDGFSKYVVIFVFGNDLIKIRCDNLDTAKMIFNSIKVDVPAKEHTTTQTATETTTQTATETTTASNAETANNDEQAAISRSYEATRSFRAEHGLDK